MSVNARDREAASRERKKVGMLVPPPLLLVALAALSAAAEFLWRGAFAVSAPGAVVGAAVMLASVVLLMWCGRQFLAACTPFRPVAPATAVVTSGPYRFSRNPMYLGMAGLLAGAGILLGSSVFAAAVVIFLAVVHFGVVLPEERYLAAVHAEAYRRYRQSVRRWL